MDAPARIAAVRGADGYELRYRVWEAQGAPDGASDGAPRATLVLLNGVTGHAGWFQPLAGPLAAAGVALVGADRRGSGLNRTGLGDAPSAGALIDDAARILDAERRPGVPLHLGGWCWGAVLAANVAGHRPDGLAGVAFLAPGFHPAPAVAAAMAGLEAAAGAWAADTPCLEVPIPDTLFTRGPHLAAIAADGLRCRRITPRFLAAMKALAMGAALALRRLRLPTLLVLAGDDEATDNAATLAAFARRPGPPPTVTVLAGAHGLPFEAPEALAAALADWTCGGAA